MSVAAFKSQNRSLFSLQSFGSRKTPVWTQKSDDFAVSKRSFGSLFDYEAIFTGLTALVALGVGVGANRTARRAVEIAKQSQIPEVGLNFTTNVDPITGPSVEVVLSCSGPSCKLTSFQV